MTNEASDIPQRLAEIRARVEAATPGPWRRLPATHRGGFTFGENEIVTEAGTRVVTWGGFDGADGPKTQHRRNAIFVAQAREDIPFLLDLIAEMGGEQRDSGKPVRPDAGDPDREVLR